MTTTTKLDRKSLLQSSKMQQSVAQQQNKSTAMIIDNDNVIIMIQPESMYKMICVINHWVTEKSLEKVIVSST